ncbi:MAG: hypothetical protein AB2689_25810 [Candidatus Thiodiazotropha taylori]
MKLALPFMIMCIMSYPITVYSLPNNYDNKAPGDFRVSCKTVGANKYPSNADITWDSKSKKMIITGDSINDDNNRLYEGEGYKSKHTIHIANTFMKGFKLANKQLIRPDIRTIYMTFREEHEPSYDVYRGDKWETIRTFEFHIRKGEPGSVIATDASDINGILIASDRKILFDCTYTGITTDNPNVRILF